MPGFVSALVPTSNFLLENSLQTVGRCGTLHLDGRASSGAASRTISASWNISAAVGAGANASTAAGDALAPFQGSLLAELNATALEVGVEFTFRLSLENFFGSTDEAIATVTRRFESSGHQKTKIVGS